MRKTLAVAIAGLALAASAAPARAGTYDVWSCAGPDGEPLPADGWTPESKGGSTSSTCGEKLGSLDGSLPARLVGPGDYARWTFDAPPETTIEDLTIHRWVGASRGYDAHWYRSYFLFRDAPVLVEGYVFDLCVDLNGPCSQPGSHQDPFGAPNEYSTPVKGLRVIASAQCDGSVPCGWRDLAPVGRFSIYRARIGIADAHPPTFKHAPSGSLLVTSAAVDGERSVRVDGRDAGGGLYSAEVIVDGATVAEARIAPDGTCRKPFFAPVPCPADAAATVALDTAALDNGRHHIQTALVDAAGNRTLSNPVHVVVTNAKEPNGAGASRIARLTARFRSTGSNRTERVVGFGKRAVVVGRLVNGASAPIAHAEVAVHTRLDRLGARERIAATVRTGADGRFRWKVSRGPSRFIRVAYRAYKSDVGESASAEVRLGVRPRIALSVRPRHVRNRGRIAFRGRLVGGPGKGGVQLTIEAVGRSVRQRVPVTTLRTDRRGRFRFSYRFLRSFAPFTYRFRARLMRQASYPYAGGASRIVTVKIVR